jgi:hypothetical protein
LVRWKCDSSRVYVTLRSRVSCFIDIQLSIKATWKKIH